MVIAVDSLEEPSKLAEIGQRLVSRDMVTLLKGIERVTREGFGRPGKSAATYGRVVVELPAGCLKLLVCYVRLPRCSCLISVRSEAEMECLISGTYLARNSPYMLALPFTDAEAARGGQ